MMFVIHQVHRFDPKEFRNRKRFMRVVRDDESDPFAGCPTDQRSDSRCVFDAFPEDRLAAVGSENRDRKSGIAGEFDRLGVIARRPDNFMPATFEFRRERPKERHVR